MAVSRRRGWRTAVVVFGALGVLMALLIRRLAGARARARAALEPIRGRLRDACNGDVALTLNPALWADLPPYARRYLRHAVGEAHRHPLGMQFTVHGEFRVDVKKEDWWPLTAEQWISPEHGFFWEATVRRGPVFIEGADWFLDGEGGQEFRFLGLVPFLSNRDDPEVNRSALGRLLIEQVMTPWVWLPSRGARWTARKDRRVEVALPHVDHPPVVLTIAADGRVQRAEILRWRADKEAGEQTFFVTVRDEMEVQGWYLPRVIEAGWVDVDGNDQPYYKAEMVAIE